MTMRCRSILVIALALTMTVVVSAKGDTSRITISGGQLAAPIDITDPAIVKPFQVWSGPGTSVCHGPDNCADGVEGFIVDWSAGPVDEPPAGLPRYEVSFYVTDPRFVPRPRPERLAYVVSFAYDAATSPGYVYLPGKGDPSYRLNVASILRGREGHWFHATRAWQDAASRFLRGADAYFPLRLATGPSTPFGSCWSAS